MAASLISSISLSQKNKKLDSLEAMVRNSNDDSSRIRNLVLLAEEWTLIDISKADSIARNTFELSKKKGIIYGIASSKRTIGNIYSKKGNYPKALENYLEALKGFEKINNLNGIALTTSNIGIIYYFTGKFENALKYFLQSISLFEKMNDKYGMGSPLTNAGACAFELGRLKEAKEYYTRCLKISEEANDHEGIVNGYGNLAMVIAAEGDHRKAISYYEQALAFHSNFGLNYLGEQLYEGISYEYMALADFKVALSYGQKALEAAKSYGDQNDKSHAYLLLSQILDTTGDYKNSLVNFKLHSLMKDSLLNIESQHQITEMQTKYETEKKEKEIQLLNKDKQIQFAEIKRQTLIKNSTLGGVGIAGIFSFLLIRSFIRRRKTSFEKQVSEVEMKALRSQMNPHFIFNSLQSIKKYVLENAKNDAAEYLSKFSTLMRLILENSRKQEVSLEKDLSALELYMELESLRFQNRFQYAIEVDPQIDKEDTMIAPLLLQPFVENSIIHGISSKENGMIKIRVNKKDNMIHCTVEDNGIGRDQSVQVETGEKKKRESLGMKITQERLNIINQLKKVKTAVNIFDLKDAENKPGGLRVELLLPFETSF